MVGRGLPTPLPPTADAAVQPCIAQVMAVTHANLRALSADRGENQAEFRFTGARLAERVLGLLRQLSLTLRYRHGFGG
jgi:hypothetical protein